MLCFKLAISFTFLKKLLVRVIFKSLDDLGQINGVIATEKPWNNALISSTAYPCQNPNKPNGLYSVPLCSAT